MREEIEHTCQFCYYEYFDGRAYPCSMCVCGEERKDMFQPKGRQNKRKDEIVRSNLEPFRVADPKDEPQTDCTTCDQVGRCDRGRAVECPLTDCAWK